MAKRKRDTAAKQGNAAEQPRKARKAAPELQKSSDSKPSTSKSTNSPPTITTTEEKETTATVQIVTGSYERVLHGITATISTDDSVQFADTFLFHAHASSIRCLALSPLSEADSSQPQKLVLATGGSDERINLYSLSASPPPINDRFPSVPTLVGSKILENPKNRELGSLLHHSASISSLCFPTRSKLLAAAEDNLISVTRTRDWSVVSTIKAPRPKVLGRPSGDTAPPGASPSGVNDFAVHPSMKLMLSVGKGERCMRLWNLVTGKKAGVLNFDRNVLLGVKEGKWSTGEGRRICWDSQGEEFAVAFERGAVVFGTDSIPKCRIFPSPMTKLHHIRYIPLVPTTDGADELLAASTEDGRIMFYSTKEQIATEKEKEATEGTIPLAKARGQLGGKDSGALGRVKDFEILPLSDSADGRFLIITCNSDGAVRVWMLNKEELTAPSSKKANGTSGKKGENQSTTSAPRQVGKLLGTHETGNRVTCLKAFVMLNPVDDMAAGDSDFAAEEEGEEEEEEDSDEDSD